MLRYAAFLALFIILAFVSADCQQNIHNQMTPAGANTSTVPGSPSDITKAVAILHCTKGNDVSGTVTFTKEGNVMKIVADVIGLKPGKHGFHIHEYGDCSSDDGTSAGGHFNPDKMQHGSPTDSAHHEGDLGNIEAGADGKAHLEMTDSLLSFSGPHSILGRGVIIHSAIDDFTSQPAGNAGPRLACGVIGVAKP